MNDDRGSILLNVLAGIFILSILVAIALPNFQLEQIHSKIALSHRNVREIGLALESYRIDRNAYPMDFNPFLGNLYGGDITLYPLTTPIAYIPSIPNDPFNLGPPYYTQYLTLNHKYIYYGPATINWWRINAPGVLDLYSSFGYSTTALQWIIMGSGPIGNGVYLEEPYDPTNGIISGGTIFQLGP